MRNYRHADPSKVRQIWDTLESLRANKQNTPCDKLVRALRKSLKLKDDQIRLLLDEVEGDGLVEKIEPHFGKSGTEGYRLPDFSKPFIRGKHDWYCFHCHKPGEMLRCSECFRSYHLDCAHELTRQLSPPGKSMRSPILSDEDGADFTCPVCFERPKCGYSRKQIRKLLEFATHHLRKQALWKTFIQLGTKGEINKNEYLVFKYIDLELLQRKMKDGRYAALEEFAMDIELLVHDVCILYGPFSEQADEARFFLRSIKNEIKEIQLCTDCYINAKAKVTTDWISKPCKPPHELIWARNRTCAGAGFFGNASIDLYFWPAKVLLERDDGYEIRFFGGTHERRFITKIHTKPFHLPADEVGVLRKSNAPAHLTTLGATGGFERAWMEVTRLQSNLDNGYYTHSSGESDLPPSDDDYSDELYLVPRRGISSSCIGHNSNAHRSSRADSVHSSINSFTKSGDGRKRHSSSSSQHTSASATPTGGSGPSPIGAAALSVLTSSSLINSAKSPTGSSARRRTSPTKTLNRTSIASSVGSGVGSHIIGPATSPSTISLGAAALGLQLNPGTPGAAAFSALAETKAIMAAAKAGSPIANHLSSQGLFASTTKSPPFLKSTIPTRAPGPRGGKRGSKMGKSTADPKPDSKSISKSKLGSGSKRAVSVSSSISLDRSRSRSASDSSSLVSSRSRSSSEYSLSSVGKGRVGGCKTVPRGGPKIKNARGIRASNVAQVTKSKALATNKTKQLSSVSSTSQSDSSSSLEDEVNANGLSGNEANEKLRFAISGREKGRISEIVSKIPASKTTASVGDSTKKPRPSIASGRKTVSEDIKNGGDFLINATSKKASSSVANRSPTKINSAPAIASKKRPLVNGGKASKTSKRGPPAKSIKKSHSDVEASSSHSGGSSTEEEHPSQEEEEEEEEDELTDRCCSPSNITTEDYTGKKRGASVGKRKCSSVRPVPNVTEGIATGAKKRNSSLAALAIGASTTIGRASTGITGSKKTSSLGASAGRRRVARSRSRSSSVSSNASSESLRAGDVGSSSHSSLSSDALRDSGKPGAGGSSFSRYCSHSTCLADGDTLHTAGASSTMLRRPPFAPPISTVGGATNVGGLSGQTGSSSGDATSGSAAPGSQLIGSHHHHHHHGHGHGHSSSTSVGGVVSSATSSSTHEAMLAAATCLAGSNHPLAGALGQAASGLLNVSGAGASGTLQPPIGFSTVPRSHLPPNKRAAAAAAAAALGAGSNIGLIDTTGFSALTGNLASPGPARIDAFTAATGLMPSTGTSLSGHGFSSSVATGAGSSPGSQVSPASAPQLIKRMASKAIQTPAVFESAQACSKCRELEDARLASQTEARRSLRELEERLTRQFTQEKEAAVQAAVQEGQLRLREAVEREQKAARETMEAAEARFAETIVQAKRRQWCRNCLTEAIYHCCWNTSYCSIQCQQEHWQKEHKRQCRRKR